MHPQKFSEWSKEQIVYKVHSHLPLDQSRCTKALQFNTAFDLPPETSLVQIGERTALLDLLNSAGVTPVSFLNVRVNAESDA